MNLPVIKLLPVLHHAFNRSDATAHAPLPDYLLKYNYGPSVLSRALSEVGTSLPELSA